MCEYAVKYLELYLTDFKICTPCHAIQNKWLNHIQDTTGLFSICIFTGIACIALISRSIENVTGIMRDKWECRNPIVASVLGVDTCIV